MCCVISYCITSATVQRTSRCLRKKVVKVNVWGLDVDPFPSVKSLDSFVCFSLFSCFCDPPNPSTFLCHTVSGSALGPPAHRVAAGSVPSTSRNPDYNPPPSVRIPVSQSTDEVTFRSEGRECISHICIIHYILKNTLHISPWVSSFTSPIHIATLPSPPLLPSLPVS